MDYHVNKQCDNEDSINVMENKMMENGGVRTGAID